MLIGEKMTELERRKAELEYLIKETEKGLAARQAATYRRGDAENNMNDMMFISIFRQELDYMNERGRLMTPVEGRQVLRDHGWTVTEK
jgi:hypothetical protein